MHYFGRGVPQDFPEALKWFRLSAMQGFAKAQYNFGVMHEKGQGQPQNFAEALRWFRLAAAQGFVDAQYNIGAMYAEGRGVKQDSAIATNWFRLAATAGSVDAQYNLGVMYAKSTGAADLVRAHMWLDVAAISGDADAAKSRDIVANQMTPQQIAAAKKLMIDCKARNFNGCD